MEPEVRINKPQNRRRKVLIILSVLIAVMLLSASSLAYVVLQYGYTYKGVYINGIDVSGMSRQEMQQMLEERYNIPAAGQEIILKTRLAELKATYPDLGVHYNVDAAVDAAYSLGRDGNIFVRLYDIAQAALWGVEYNVLQSYDEEKLNDFVTNFSQMAFQSVREGALLVADNKVVIRSGRHGESIDKAEVLSLASDMIRSGTGGVIEPKVIITGTTAFNADEIYDRIICEPSEAFYKLENNSLILIPHKAGRQIDKSLLERIVDEVNKTEDQEHLLPVTFTEPDITQEKAMSMLFRDELANFSTPFETRTQNEKNRMHNIALAVSKFNDYILMPEEEFSFNAVVGPRNEKYGYKEAHVYINGRVEDGVGGGICQAVSTLYNAVLFSDLKVLERRNHSFIVTYVPLGQDATAYYGGTDFRFVNTTGWPIKIISWVEDNKVHVIFKGTKTEPEKTVLISNKTLSRTPYTTKYVDDPKLPAGTVAKSQYGTDGFVVETYKTVKIGEKVVSQIKLHTSRYNPCAEEFRVGILQPDGTTTPGLAAKMKAEAEAAKASTAQTPSDPAGSGSPASTDTTTAAETPEAAETPAGDQDQSEPAGASEGSQDTSDTANTIDTSDNAQDTAGDEGASENGQTAPDMADTSE
jgi:vancomycin resistance protein YoaR